MMQLRAIDGDKLWHVQSRVPPTEPHLENRFLKRRQQSCWQYLLAKKLRRREATIVLTP